MSTTCASRLRLEKGMKHVITLIMVTLLFDMHRYKMTALCAEIPKREITCRAGTFIAGENASLSCNFPTDVAADGDDVFVGRLPVNASKDAIWIDTLACRWKDSKQPYECDATEGFSFDGVISDHLTLHIHEVDNTKAGTYICFIASSDIHSTECELTVTEARLTSPETTTRNVTSSPSIEKDADIIVALISILIVLVLIIVMSGLLVFLLRRRLTRNKPTRDKEEVALLENRSGEPLPPAQPPNEKVLKILDGFNLSTQALELMMERLNDEMNTLHQADKEANDKTYSVPIKSFSNETGKKDDGIIVVEISNAVVRIHYVRLEKPKHETKCTNYPIPTDVKHGTGIQLLDFIADCAKQFYRGKFHKKKLCLGLVFPFPCEYSGELTEASLTKWASGFRCEDVTGQTLQVLLEDAFRRKHPKSRLEITVILNDAAGTLLSLVKHDPNCCISVSLADSFHACCMQRENINTNPTTENNMVFTNTVLGALGESGCLEELVTEFDKDLDLHSIHPGRQTLEKMVSMTYVGEIVRLVLTRLAKKGLLFHTVSSRSVLVKKECFTADFVSLIESDRSEQHLLTDYVLRQLQVEHYTKEDCTIVSYVVQLVLKRAAHLAAAGLAVLIKPLVTSNVTVAVDGALCRYHPEFLRHLEDQTRELLKPEKEVEFKQSYYGSVIGAALAANVPRSSHTAKHSLAIKTLMLDLNTSASAFFESINS